MSFIYSMTDTWSAIGTTFTSIKMAVTDTASAVGSLLMDLQVGGASKYNVSKTGATTQVDKALVNLSGGTPPAQLSGSQTLQTVGAVGSTQRVNFDSFAGLTSMFMRRTNGTVTVPTALANNDFIGTFTFTGFGTTIYAGGGATISCTASEAWTDTANGAALTFRTTANTTIAQTDRWTISNAGHFLGAADNTYDIGASGGSRPRNAFIAGFIKGGVTTVAALPAAATAGAGARLIVTDALTPVFGSNVAAGGAVTVPVYSDNANWKVG